MHVVVSKVFHSHGIKQGLSARLDGEIQVRIAKAEHLAINSANGNSEPIGIGTSKLGNVIGRSSAVVFVDLIVDSDDLSFEFVPIRYCQIVVAYALEDILRAYHHLKECGPFDIASVEAHLADFVRQELMEREEEALRLKIP
jgi:hypothetical protein